MSDAASTRRDLVRSLLRARDRAAALRLARRSRRFCDEKTSRLVLEQFNRTVWREIAQQRAAVRAGSAIAAADRGPITRAIWLRMDGLLARKSGRLTRARQRLCDAARLLEEADRHLEAGDLHRILVDTLILAEDDDEARRAASKARRCYARAGGADAARRAGLAMNLGNLHHRREEHARALREYDRARRLYRQAGDDRRLAYAEFNRANILTSLDRTREARLLYEKAGRAFRAAGQPALLAKAECGLAALDCLEGRLDDCIQRLEDVAARQRELGYDWGLAHAELDAADAYLRTNRCSEAERAALRAERYFRRAGHETERALCAGVLGGVALRQGRPGRAARLLSRGRETQRKLANPVGAAMLAIGHAQAETAAGRPDRGLRLARRSAEVFRRRGLRSREARALAVGADAARTAGHLRLSRSWGERALLLARRTRDQRVELRALMALARLEEMRGRRAVAYRRLLAAERTVEKLRRGLTSEESRLAFAVDKSEVYEALIRNRLELADQKSVRQALFFAERGKARALAERLASGDALGLVGTGPRARKLVRRLDRIERELAVAESRLASEQRPSGLRSIPANRVKLLTDSRMRTLRQLARDDPRYAMLLGATPLDAGEMIEALGPGELVLEYAEAGGFFHLFVIESGGVSVFKELVPVDRVRSAACMLRFHLGKAVLGERYAARFSRELLSAFKSHFEDLHRMLLDPVADRLVGKNVQIVPHGILHGLPFHAFESGDQALVDRCVISYAPSLTTLNLLRRRSRDVAAPPVILGSADATAPLIDSEIDAVRRCLDIARVVRGPESAEEALRTGEPRPELLHVACHGFYSDSAPWSSGLKLGDAWLSLADLYALQGAAEFVVLSGCETGRGAVYSGDEWVGLVGGFLQAGARSVVASLWEVHDRATVGLMQEFYGGLSGGATAAEALNAAQRAARREDPLPLRWAPFAVVGDPGFCLRTAKAA